MSIKKFGRKYELIIYPAKRLVDTSSGGTALVSKGSESVTVIKDPFTIDFQITRRALASSNLATFKIYNLNENTRNRIYKDFIAWNVLRRVTLKAGYSEPLPIIFDGNIKWSVSYRSQGTTEFISEIEAYDYAFAMQNSYSNWTLPTGSAYSTTKKDVVDKLISDLSAYGVSRGVVSSQGMSEIYEKKTISDWTWNALKREVNGNCFIDNGKINILFSDEYFSSVANEISSETGLLGSPKKSDTYVVVESIFEPNLVIGQSVELKTRSQKIFNRLYKVVGIQHAGTISESVGGAVQTNVHLYSFSENKSLVELSL